MRRPSGEKVAVQTIPFGIEADHDDARLVLQGLADRQGIAVETEHRNDAGRDQRVVRNLPQESGEHGQSVGRLTGSCQFLRLLEFKLPKVL